MSLSSADLAEGWDWRALNRFVRLHSEHLRRVYQELIALRRERQNLAVTALAIQNYQIAPETLAAIDRVLAPPR